MSEKQKNPFVGFTPEEVAKAESNSFVIQVGGDFFCYDGDYSFSKAGADHYYDQITEGLYDLLKNGSRLEKEDAFNCLTMLKIIPLRIH